MKKLIMCKGLPGSGKSFWAKEKVDANPGMYKRVNKDDLRAMVDNSKWSKANEKLILEIRDQIIESSLDAGYHVIVDDTNFDPKHERDLKLLAAKGNAEFEIKFFDTPIQECIRRDSKRENPVGEKVIRDMYNRYLKKDESFKYYPYDPYLRNCIIVDIDGTLAQKGDRDIYDGSKVGLDIVIEPIKYICNKITGVYIILMSGRDSKYREVTMKRLGDNNIDYDYLFMRDEGDNRDDVIVKTELREEYIKDKYNVLFAIDDRRKVVDNRRDLGIFTLDVNQQRSMF